MTADELARFIAGVRDAGVLAGDVLQLLHVKLKFGDSIDQDEDAMSWEEEIIPGCSELHGIEWDLDLTGALQDTMDALASDHRRIYRAYASLGTPIRAVLEPITRTNSPENDRDYCPDSLSIEIGPIEIYDLGSDAPAFVGWIGVNLSGYGYLFPWTFRDVLNRLHASREIQRITDLCRSFWPVPPEAPEPRIVELRKRLGSVWPYDDFDRQWDWYWGLQESG